jgi:hypothetical protein
MLALIALVGNIANAELLKNFKYDGKIEVNAFQVKDTDYNKNAADKTNDVDTRVQINAGFDLTEDVDAVVSIVKNNEQYGDAGRGEDANTIMDNMFFEQAYLNLKGVLGFDHKLGRQYYGNEGDLIVYYGPQGWPYTSAMNRNAIDGYTGWYKTGKWDFHGILAKDADTNLVGDNDEDIFGLNAKYDLMEEVKLTGYFYRYNEQSGTAFAGPADHLDTFGVKAMGVFKGFEYNAEVAKNMGKNNRLINNVGGAATNDYTGMAFLANAKYGMDLAGKITFMGEFAMGSGDDNVAATDDEAASFYSPNSDYRPGILWGGSHLSVIGGAGLSNLTTFNLGAMWNPSNAEKLTLGAKYFNFSPTEKLTGTAKSYDTYGNEFDLCANWQHNESVGLKAYYAMFMPDKDYAQRNSLTASDDSTEILGAAFSVKF